MSEPKKYTKEEILAWAQAIYDRRGPPPYYPHPDGTDCKEELELLTDFMYYWMPYVKRDAQKSSSSSSSSSS